MPASKKKKITLKSKKTGKKLELKKKVRSISPKVGRVASKY